jgi:hypothetical protein
MIPSSYSANVPLQKMQSALARIPDPQAMPIMPAVPNVPLILHNAALIPRLSRRRPAGKRGPRTPPALRLNLTANCSAVFIGGLPCRKTPCSGGQAQVMSERSIHDRRSSAGDDAG